MKIFLFDRNFWLKENDWGTPTYDGDIINSTTNLKYLLQIFFANLIIPFLVVFFNTNYNWVYGLMGGIYFSGLISFIMFLKMIYFYYKYDNNGFNLQGIKLPYKK